jgi:hypothetical protein
VPQFERLYTGNKVLSLLIAIGWIIAAWTTHKAVAGVLWLLITILVSWNLWAFDTSAESCGFEGPTSLGVGLLLYSAEWIGLSLAAAFQLALASTAKPLTM